MSGVPSVALLVLVLATTFAEEDVEIEHPHQTGGNSAPSPDKPLDQVLFTFQNDDVEWDPVTDSPRVVLEDLRPPVPKVVMEVHRVQVPDSDLTMRSVRVKEGQFSVGHLVGCYTGPMLNQSERDAKLNSAPESEMAAYTFLWNDTHEIDPTNAEGIMPDDLEGYEHDEEGKSRSKMPLFNEPGRGLLPNIVVSEEGWCKDKESDRTGIPYYAFRNIFPGDELSLCYGLTYTNRPYETVCESEAFWSGYMDGNRRLVDNILSPPEEEDVESSETSEDVETSEDAEAPSEEQDAEVQSEQEGMLDEVEASAQELEEEL